MRHRSRIRALAPVLLAIATAEAGARLLTPAEHARPLAAVDPDRYFSSEQQRRGAHYARGQAALGLLGGTVQLVLLVALARWMSRAPPHEDLGAEQRPDAGQPPEPARPGMARAVAGGAAGAAGLAAAGTIVSLPVSALSRRRALKVGLATQSWERWVRDLLKESAIQTAFAAAGGGAVVGLARRWPRGWWAPAAAASVTLGTGLAALAPVLLDPLFNDFEPLAHGPIRADVLALAAAAGVKVGEVFSVDASRRTTAANAYVTGLGPTKRVVLFDTLLSGYDRDEVGVVVAHELGHVRFRDVAGGVAYAALLSGPVAFAVQRLSWALAPGREGTPGALPALVLATGVVSMPVGIIGNRLSRAIERRADQFSLTLSGGAAAFVSFERKIALQNVADLRPPRWLSRLAAHPPTLERIAMATAVGFQAPALAAGVP